VRDLERRAKEIRDALQIALGGRPQQPHQEKKRHHRRHEIGVRDFPRTAVVAGGGFLDALDDDRALGIVSHDYVGMALCMRLLFLDVFFKFRERRPLRRVQHLAAEFDRERR
jgi:hypothetical protein